MVEEEVSEPEESLNRNFFRIGKLEKYSFILLLGVHIMSVDWTESWVMAAKGQQAQFAYKSTVVCMEGTHDPKGAQKSPPRPRRRKRIRAQDELSLTSYTSTGGDL